MSIATKYRPKKIEDLIGQPIAQRVLTGLLTDNQFPSTVLFLGQRGCGKTTAARIAASALLCEEPGLEPCGVCPSCRAIAAGSSLSYQEIDCGSSGSIDNIREMVADSNYAIGKRIYFLDECHLLSSTAQAALLKSLEEPPKNVWFFLATTDPHKMSDALRSRAVEIRLKPLTSKAIRELLTKVCEAETIPYTPQSIDALIHVSRGGARDALTALEQTKGITDPDFILDSMGFAPLDTIAEFAIKILQKDYSASMILLNDLAESYEIPAIYEALILTLNNFNKVINGIKVAGVSVPKTVNSHLVLDLLEQLEKADSSIKYSYHKREWLEVMIARFTQAGKAPKLSLDSVAPVAPTLPADLTLPTSVKAFAAKCEFKKVGDKYQIKGPGYAVNAVKKQMPGVFLDD